MRHPGIASSRLLHGMLVSLACCIALTCTADSIDDADPPAPVAVPAVVVADLCAAPVAEIPQRTERASAGIMYNLAEHPESIRAVAKDLLGHAVAASAAAQELACEAACPQQRSDTIVFKVTPTIYRSEYEQQPLCVQLAEQTAAQPLRYGERIFASVDELDTWMMNFTQGRGDDGKLLYEQCGGNCDPSYTFFIEPDDDNLHVNAEVFCGFARDRGNGDMFEISTLIRPRCER